MGKAGETREVARAGGQTEEVARRNQVKWRFPGGPISNDQGPGSRIDTTSAGTRPAIVDAGPVLAANVVPDWHPKPFSLAYMERTGRRDADHLDYDVCCQRYRDDVRFA